MNKEVTTGILGYGLGGTAMKHFGEDMAVAIMFAGLALIFFTEIIIRGDSSERS